jgi:thymidylate synthase ThyX
MSAPLPGPTTPPIEAFTPEEQARLAPFVTNLDRPVFVLTGLPEVIKGALFSRYSRTTLGLRRLLLKEFIEGADAAFADLTQTHGDRAPQSTPGTKPSGAEAHLAVRRAQDFYDRILDGYGDDSIGELGGAHLAAEGISMLAAKAIQDARIGGSPLEKSTRYVSFGQQVNGDFLFCKEPVLMDSAHRDRYLDLCRALFSGYRDWHEPVAAYIRDVSPRGTDVTERAWRTSVTARAYDALRGLLPAATLTNMGVFGNGRFFESLLVKMHLSDLAELRGLAVQMQAELDKVIPSFVRRADPDHPHFAGFRQHRTDQTALLRRLGDAVPRKVSRTEATVAGVQLVDHDADAEVKVVAALAYSESQGTLEACRRWAAALAPQERAKILGDLAATRANRRHKPPRAAELAVYTFDLVGDFGMYRDMHRHRMLTQERQALSTRLGFEVTDDVRDAGVEPRFRALMEQAADTYERIAVDHPLEAQYGVPMAYRIRWSMTVNLRALIWLCELRSQPQGHPAYRRMAQALYATVRVAHPGLATLFRYVDTSAPDLGRLGAEQRQDAKRAQR